MPLITVQISKKKDDTQQLETDDHNVAGLLAILASQVTMKDPCGCADTLLKEIQRRFKGGFVLTEFLQLSLNDSMSVMRCLQEGDSAMRQEIERRLSDYAGARSAGQIILEVGTTGALALNKLGLGPKDLMGTVKGLMASEQKKGKEMAIRRQAERERTAILTYLRDCIRFCELVLASARVRTEPIRAAARKLLKKLNQERQRVETSEDAALAKEGLSLQVHQLFRTELVELRDLVREDVLSNNLPPPSSSTVTGTMQLRNDERLFSMLRLLKSSDLVEYEVQVNQLRLGVWMALRTIVPSLSLLNRFGPCRLCYRGSLTDAVRNAKKSGETSTGKVAQLLDLSAFDVDAFIEVPDALWEYWCGKKFVPALNVARGKCSLTDIRNHLAYFLKSPPEGEEERYTEARLLQKDLSAIITVMENVARPLLAQVP
ncbi:MAG TPA: hypothetical protein VK447_07135, partial [Myxococcaceae bacterium]|nr:hypothetical protein [Myxococcaceae bacterium]